MGLPCGEEIVIVGRTMWTQSTSVTDRRTDRRTDRITITDTVQTASHGNYSKLELATTYLNLKKLRVALLQMTSVDLYEKLLLYHLYA